MARKNRLSWLFALLFVAQSGIARAEDSSAPAASPAPAPTVSPAPPEETPEDAEANGQIIIATPTPAAIINDAGEEVVEPLDVWAPISPTATPTKAVKAVVTGPPGEGEENEEEVSGDAEDEGSTDEPVELETVETDAQLPEDAANKAALSNAVHPRRIQLTKQQRRRMNAAKMLRRKIVREQRKLFGLGDSLGNDPRGEPELRLCSLNFNNYAGKDDYKRVFKAAKLPVRAKLEQSIVSAIGQGKCDVVAFQGYMGYDEESLGKGIKVLEAKLKTETGAEWEVHFSPANRDIVRNGFLIRKGSSEVVRVDSFGTMKFNVFGSFQGVQFARMPFEIVLKVKGKGKSRERTLLLMTFDFRNNFNPNDKEPETLRMQMADALRQIIHTESGKFPGEDPPIVVLLGDRRNPRYTPATQLLEGRSRIADFTANGGCTLNAEMNKITCKPGIVHFKEFFGVSTEGLGEPPKVKTKNVDGVEKKVLVYPSEKVDKARLNSLVRHTAEIYFQNRELDGVLEKPFLPGRYRAGTIRVSTGLPASPLVWAEVNW